MSDTPRALSRRRFLGGTLAAGAAAGIGPWGPVHAQPARKTLIYAKNEDIGQLNPYFVNHGVFEALNNHIQEPLVRFDYEKRAWEPVLAESWTVEDGGRTWVFRLREAKFHSGEPFTAADVKYTFETVVKEKSAGPIKANLFMIESIAVRDPRTVAIRCKGPTPGMLSYIQSRPSIMSRALGEKVGFDEAHKKMVGTGPYKFVEYARDEHLVMERNPDYWGQKAKIERVVYRPIPDNTARVTALRAGQVDAMAQVAPFDIAKLQQVPDITLHSVRAARIHMLFMNPITPPLQNRLVRLAIHHGIDVDTILKTVLEGRAFRLSQLCGPSQVMTHDPDLKPLPYDPERAKKLLAQAGYPNGVDIEFHDYPAYAEYKPMGLAVAEQLKKVGVRVDIKPLETSVFRRRWFAGELSFYFIPYGNVAEDASAFLKAYFRSDQDRRSRYKNPEADALFDQQEAELDTRKRQALNRRLMRLLQEDSPAVPFHNPLYTVGTRKKVVMAPGTPTGGEFVWFWKMDIA